MNAHLIISSNQISYSSYPQYKWKLKLISSPSRSALGILNYFTDVKWFSRQSWMTNCTKDVIQIQTRKPFRWASEINHCVSNGFHNDLSLISIAQKLNASDNICASWHSSLLSKTRFPRNIFGVLLTVFTFWKNLSFLTFDKLRF